MGFESLLPDHGCLAETGLSHPEMGMPVRLRRAAPSAASIKVMHQALTLGNGVQYPGGALCRCERNLAHLVGSTRPFWEFESSHAHSMPGRLTAGLLILDQAIEVRILAGQLKIFNAGGYEGWCRSPRGVMPGA
jgi:hypothetical protein